MGFSTTDFHALIGETTYNLKSIIKNSRCCMAVGSPLSFTNGVLINMKLYYKNNIRDTPRNLLIIRII